MPPFVCISCIHTLIIAICPARVKRKSPKRRLRRIKRGDFENVPRSAGTTVGRHGPRPTRRVSVENPVGQGPCAQPPGSAILVGLRPYRPSQSPSVTALPEGEPSPAPPQKRDAEPGGSASLGCVISQYSGSFSSCRIWGRAASSPCSFSSRSHRSSRSLVS